MSQTKAQLVSGTTAQDLTVDNINTTSINSGQTSGRKNLIINGAMQVAQRATSATNNGYGSLDRFMCTHEGTDEAVTHAQVDVASGTTPYSLGLRKSMKLTNGNQTGGVGGADVVGISQAIEAQNIATSGWNFKSSSSYITVSFWCKSSVAQNFYGYFYIQDGTPKLYSFETGTLTADTWTKITKKIPGNSDITINVDNGFGLQLQLWTFLGTNYTGTTTLNQWANFDSSVRTPNFTSTWYTTNDSTFELTGVQLEVGSTATDFEHRSFGEELLLCQRYYISYVQQGCSGYIETASANEAQLTHQLPVSMRAVPSATCATASSIGVERGTLYGINNTAGIVGWIYKNNLQVGWAMDTAKTRWHTTWCRVQNVQFSAEL